MSAVSVFGAVVRHERREVSADRVLLFGLIAFTLLAVYALASGERWVGLRTTEARIAATASAERNGKFQTNLAVIEHGGFATLNQPAYYPGWAGSPMTPEARPTLPLRSLALLSTSAGELQPMIASMRANSSRFALLDDNKASTQNPMTLAIGRLDMVFLLTAVLPLLLLVASYNVLSAEREGGTLALVMAQPVKLVRVIAGKLAVRAGLILVPVVVIVVAGTLVANGSARPDLSSLTVLAGLIVIYGAFWLLLAVLVNAAGRSSSANALALGGFWLLFVLIIPSLLNVGVAMIDPLPDRAEFINLQRATLVDANKRGGSLFNDFNLQHPERPVTSAAAAYDGFDSPKATLVKWLVRERTDALTAPVAERFEARLDEQNRFTAAARFLSPALVFQSAVERLAGVDRARSRAFELAARAHLARMRAFLVPKAMTGQKITSADYDRLPRFAMSETGVVIGQLADWLGLALPALLVGFFAYRGIGRYRLSA